MIDQQADDHLPAWVLRYLGAAKIHVQRTQFILAIFNTGSIALTVYFTTPLPNLTIPGTSIQPFTTVFGWLSVVALVAGLFLVVDRVLLYPAEISYNSHQASHRERNPGYDVTVDSNERIQRIEDELDITQTDGGIDTEADE
ncbi:hypothetical protein [Halobacterium sp. CBA1126]|uniref:hypothetical protein n=1 Tax=Halobacterium sp. CBA1126 TaxID=2668074 RepID=UPI0012FAAF3D|nr:hypothetical protein [Halobacterium sp. CBA1126]MUV59771.1 hypothetical protein [Halobacterium sp. CBA1126]